MRLFGREVEGAPKVIVTLVAILLVASGLCGTQLVILSAANGNQGLATIFMITGALELLAMVGSAAGIVVMLIVWALNAAMRKPPQPPAIEELPTGSDQDQPS